MTARTSALGRYGEDVAARWLAEAGMTVLDRNWRCRTGGLVGELDIVALDGDVLAVCEVKTRTESGLQEPAEGVTPDKAGRLRALAEGWVRERWRGPLPPGGLRIDVLCVLHGRRGPARVTRLRGAVG